MQTIPNPSKQNIEVKIVAVEICKTKNTDAEIYTFDNNGKPFVIKFEKEKHNG